jgi:hypothetical protein
MSDALDNILKGLVLHYLHQGTVHDAIKQGSEAGVPAEILESIPIMMFEVISAAGAVFTGARTLDDVLDQMSEGASATENEKEVARMNIARLIQVALEFMKELAGERGSDSPLPEMTMPWYKYGDKKGHS